VTESSPALVHDDSMFGSLRMISVTLPMYLTILVIRCALRRLAVQFHGVVIHLLE